MSIAAASQDVLAHFWDLASLEEDVREKAAATLTAALLQSQREHDAESGADTAGEEAEEGGALGGARARDVGRALRRCSPLMVYAFKRLCRGLGSSRQGARQGFSLAIASLLAGTSAVSPAEAVTAIEGVLEPVGKGADLRDALLGRIFGYAAVVRSGKPLPAGLARSLAAGLVAAAAKKSFLREASAAVLVDLCAAVDDASLARLVEGGDAPLAPWLTTPAADATPEALLLALRLWPRLTPSAAAACPLLPPGVKPKQLPRALWSDPAAAAGSKPVAAAAAALFAKPHLEGLLPVLRATTAAHPRLHSVWPTLLALLIPGFSADKVEKEQRDAGAKAAAAHPAAAPLAAFWGTVVDGDLVSSSHERKYLALQLFQLLLPHLGPDQVPLVFTPAFLRCLATNLKKADSHLHSSAKKAAERIAAYCERAAAPEVRIAVALALQRNGGVELERYTKTAGGAAAAAAAAKASKAGAAAGEAAGAANGAAAAGEAGQGEEDVAAYVRQLQDTFLQAGGQGGGEGEGEAAAAQQQRQWAVEQLCSVLKQRGQGAPGAKAQVLAFLAVHALFSVDAAAAKKSKDPQVRAMGGRSAEVPLALRRLCASRLITLADSLDKAAAQHHAPGGQGKGGKGGKGGQQQQQAAAAAAAPRAGYLGGVAALVAQLQASGAVSLATAGEGEEAAVEAALQAAASLQGTLQRMSARLEGGSASATEQQRLRALTHLLRLLLVHSLADPASADPGLAADLDTVYSVAVEGRAAPEAGDPADGSEGEGEGGAPHWHDTLMDVLLSLLARAAAPLPSAPLRDACEHCFRAFAEQLTPTGMGDMLRVLAKPLDGSAQEGGDVYASSDEEEEEGGSDQEMGSASEDEQGGSGSDDEEAEEEMTPATKAGSESEEEESEEEGGEGAANGAAGSSSDDEGMTDEAMFRLDSKLASYFATLHEGKGGGGAAARAARDELVNFKMRAAGLVEAYCKRMPASPLLPSAVVPLLAGLEGSSRLGGHQALAERLAGLIANKLCACKAEAAGAGLEAAPLEQQLRRSLYLASRSADKRVAGTAWAAYTFLQRAAAASPDAACRAKGQESAAAALSDFFTKKKSRLQRGQLEGLLRRVPALLPGSLPVVLLQAASGRNEHLRLEAFHLLAALLKAGSNGTPKSLASCGPAAAAAVLAAVSGPFSRPQRQVEALKAGCQLLQAGGGTRLSAGKGGWAAVQQAVQQALDGAGDNAKLAAALQRMEGLLAEQPSEQGKRGKQAIGGKGGPKKQKV